MRRSLLFFLAASLLLLSGSAQAATTLFTHRDCVGPGLPGTAGGPNNPQTFTVNGITINGLAITFRLTSLALEGSGGICPEEVTSLPVLPEDFTGHYSLIAKCGAGTTNPGVIFVDIEDDFVAGVATASGFNGIPCFGPLNASVSLDLTLNITPVDVFGVATGPLGAIQLQISQ